MQSFDSSTMDMEEFLFGRASSSDKNENKRLRDENIEDEGEISYSIDKGSNSVSAWCDDEEESLVVDVQSGANRLKKFQATLNPDVEDLADVNNVVSASKLSSLMKERFQTKQLDWAKLPAKKRSKDSELTSLLNKSDSLVHSSSKRGRYISAGTIDLSRCTDANIAEPSTGQITSVEFNTSSAHSNLLLVSSKDKFIRFFQVNGDKNEKKIGVHFNDMSIAGAKYLPPASGSTSSINEVVVCGRKPYFYSYDIGSGEIIKNTGLRHKGLKSHETMAISSHGKYIAFSGKGGNIHIVDGKNKMHAMDVKMNTACRTVSFLPSHHTGEDHLMLSSGLDADVYLWDLRHTGRCLSRFHNEDGSCSTSLCASPTNTNNLCVTAIGSESGVVSLYQGESYHTGNSAAPTLMKSVMNLSTRINSMAFHPSGQLLAMASEEQTDALRLVHLPSGTVFSNWPTDKTPLRKVTCMAFSGNYMDNSSSGLSNVVQDTNGYLAMGNNKGKVLLYRLKHFSK